MKAEIEWVDVKKKMPAVEGKYLVVRKSPCIGLVVSIVNYGDYCWLEEKGRRRGFYYYDSEYGEVEYEDILYWSELPKISDITIQ